MASAPKPISPDQCRAARGLLNLSQEQLAVAAGVTRKTVATFESGARAPWTENLSAIRRALEAGGIQFIPENGGGAGVRLRKPAKASAPAGRR